MHQFCGRCEASPSLFLYSCVLWLTHMQDPLAVTMFYSNSSKNDPIQCSSSCSKCGVFFLQIIHVYIYIHLWWYIYIHVCFICSFAYVRHICIWKMWEMCHVNVCKCSVLEYKSPWCTEEFWNIIHEKKLFICVRSNISFVTTVTIDRNEQLCRIGLRYQMRRCSSQRNGVTRGKTLEGALISSDGWLTWS